MDQIKPPGELTFKGNVDDNWCRFKQRFELYLLAIGADEKSDDRKVGILLTVAGSEALDVYNTFAFPDAEKDPDRGFVLYNAVIRKFDAYCSPRKNETYERYVFRSCLQKEGESIEHYITDLRIKSKSCNFGTLVDSLIRDQIVIGIREKKVTERLLREENLTLDKAVQICQAAETAAQHMQAFGSSTEHDIETTVSAVKQKHSGKKTSSNTGGTSRTNQTQSQGQGAKCSQCGYDHGRERKCPALGQTCHKCKGKDHFASRCSSNRKKVQEVQEEPQSSESDDEFYIYAMNSHQNNNDADEWISPLVVNGSLVPFKVDTGAQVNILPIKEFRELARRPRLVNKKIKLRAYNGDSIPTAGVCHTEVEFRGKIRKVMFVVATVDSQPILGLRTSENLGLIKRVHVLSSDTMSCETSSESKVGSLKELVHQYSDVFDGIGCLQVTHKIQLRDDAVPVIHAARKVPVALKSRLKTELDRLEKLNIVCRVEEPTDWVNSLVIVEKKNGKLRLCIDPKDLNQYIMREHYHIPTRSETTSDMAGARYFTKLDASSGFWQIPLAEQSAKLTTFNSPFGRYYFKRLPFGISSAPEVFHRTVEQLFQGIEGVKTIHDDILVWGSTVEEHDQRVAEALGRARQTGLKLNRDKCVFRVTSVTYLGDRLSQEGVQPDPAKVKAINEMPDPTCKKDLQRYLGMVNYLSKFVPNMSAKTVSLRSLLVSSNEWQWSHEHVKELEELKQILTTEPVLKFFDPARTTKVSTDASTGGLGAVLLQDHDGTWLPVAYASRALTSAETRYAQIEKETLGVVFGCEKFREYVYGRPTLLETDHKPLIAISKKRLCDMPPRIQRLMLRLQNYDVTFQYTPGKLLFVADALSRAYMKGQTTEERSDDVEIHVNLIKSTLPVSEDRWHKLELETAKDLVLQEVIKHVYQGWDGTAARSCQPYYHFRDELSVINGVLMKGTRVVIPSLMQPEMLKRIHEGHLGIEKCRRRARAIMYWPNMNRDIEKVVSNCDVCLKYQYKQPKELLQPHETPTRAWTKVGADLFQLHGKDYLVVVDYLSNFPEVVVLNGTRAQEVIKHTKSIFARHGIPEIMITDNGPQFSCHEFQSFAAKYEFSHVTSSPHYPQSNGQAEKMVQIVKRLMKKAIEQREDPYLALLAYRSSPLDCGLSPAELLMGRKLNTRLSYVEQSAECQQTPTNKKDQRKSYNKSAKSLHPLIEGDVVRMRDAGSWSKRAQVLDSAGTPRSYKVQTEQGQVYRRNRRDLLLTRETFAERDALDNETDTPTRDQSAAVTDEAYTSQSPTTTTQPVEIAPSNSSSSYKRRAVTKPKRLIEEC